MQNLPATQQAALLAAPFFSAAAVPVQLRVAITGALAVLVSAWVPVSVPPALSSLVGLMAILAEALVGLALGFPMMMLMGMLSAGAFGPTKEDIDAQVAEVEIRGNCAGVEIDRGPEPAAR